MNGCAVKPTLPFIAKEELKRTPPTTENKELVEFMDSHNFSFSIDCETGEITSQVTPKG
jgi:hypothetical protein